MDIIFEQKTAGSTIVMVTHEMEQVERLCDRIVLLKDGVARAYGSVTDVQEQFGGTTVQVTSAAPLPASDEYRGRSDDGADHVELALARGTDTAALLADWVRQGVAVSSFTPGRRSLNSIFVEVYGETAGA
jgi:ABC-2 type transport system ATP-binding protein